MQADAYPIDTIFGKTVQYRVPLYQRPYVWERNIEDPSEDRLTPFWEDVRQTVERYLRFQELMQAADDPNQVVPLAPHFFGAVVLGEERHPFDGIKTQEVIDGQQRFTTAQLLIAAAHRLAQGHSFTNAAKLLQKLYLNEEEEELSMADRFKLWPTNANRNAYRAVVAPNGSANTPDDPQNRIQEAYAFFESELEEWMTEIPPAGQERYVKALHTVIRNHLKFVVIELEAGDNAQEIFESLNAQGTPLLAIDLVKNYVFRRAEAIGEDLDELDQTLWRRFDDPWWRKEQRQGRFKRPRVELFLMHWLTMTKGDEVAAQGLFVEFRGQARPEVVPDGQLRGFLERFAADADLYRAFESQPPGTVEHRFFTRLNLLDTSALYPVVLRLFVANREGEMSREDLKTALKAIESWVVRRMICDESAKGYNRLAVEMLKEIDASNDPPHKTLIDYLAGATAESAYWPPDDHVTTFLVTRPLYNRLKPVRRVRLLLEACELERRGPKAEGMDAEAPQLQSTLTVEHLLPQTWQEKWSIEPSDDVEKTAERQARVHMLGNLTLATKKLNPYMSNAAWPEKRLALNEHSVMLLNSDLIANHPSHWDEAKIDARTSELAAKVVAHWPGSSSYS